MKLQKRLLYIVGIIGLFLIILSYIIFSTFFNKSFEEMDSNNAQKIAEILDFAISEKITFIEKMVGDWTIWDSAYYFIKEPNDEFISENLIPDTYINLRLNAVIILNDSREIIYQRFYDYNKKEDFEVSEKEKYLINSYLNAIGQDDSFKGLVTNGNKIVIVAGHRIFKSDKSNVSNGFIIFARYLDDNEIESLGNSIGYQLKFEITPANISSIAYSQKWVEVNENVYKRYIDVNHAEFMSQVYSIDNKPIMISHISVNRDPYIRINMIFLGFYIILFFCLIILTTLIYFIIDRFITKKISQMDSMISEMIIKNDLSKKIEIEGDEEITNLCNNFNKLTLKIKEEENNILKKNKELEEMNNNLRKLDELKDNFISNVSHELRTPLTSIQSYNQLMKDGILGPVSKKQKEALEIILESTKNLTAIICEILDISKYDSGKMHLNISDVDLKKLFMEVKVEFVPALKKIGGKISMKVDKGLMIRADSDKIRQIMRNHLSNSIKYRSERKLRIDIKVESKLKDVVINIRDNGIGISEENIKKLFNRFFQVDQGMTRKIEGSGLGLSIVKSIVALHKGEMKVESEIGKYTEFKIILPKEQ